MSMSKKHIKTYKNIYFDIDRTLWDTDSNSRLTLSQLIEKHIPDLLSRFDEFLNIFHVENEKLWAKYRDGEVTKEYLREKRFDNTFVLMGIDAPMVSSKINEDFIKVAPYKTGLFPNTIEVLEYLKGKGYRLFLLTNGFIEVQKIKIRESKLEPFFEKMITSEDAGYQKPHKKIFELALKTVNSRKSESIMIGDDLENDILGSKRFGMDTVFFNPQKVKHNSNPTFEIHGLNELKQFL